MAMPYLALLCGARSENHVRFGIVTIFMPFPQPANIRKGQITPKVCDQRNLNEHSEESNCLFHTSCTSLTNLGRYGPVIYYGKGGYKMGAGEGELESYTPIKRGGEQKKGVAMSKRVTKAFEVVLT